MNKVWTELEKDYIRQNAGLLSDTEGARLLSQIANRKISVHAWRKQRQKLGIKKAPGRGVCSILEAPIMATPPLRELEEGEVAAGTCGG